MAAIPAHRRPHYPPTERMAILELRAARGWNQVQTAQAMLVTPEAVASWNRRVDEQGPHALVQLPEPVNRFPDFVRLIVRCLKALCPTLGKVGIARILARAGLHLAATTVGQILKGEPPCPDPATTASEDMPSIEGPKLAQVNRPVALPAPRLCFAEVVLDGLAILRRAIPENAGLVPLSGPRCALVGETSKSACVISSRAENSDVEPADESRPRARDLFRDGRGFGGSCPSAQEICCDCVIGGLDTCL
jgi:hypothetical protein